MGYIPLLGFLQDSSSRVSPPQDSYSRGPPPGSLFQDSSSRIPLPAFLSESFTSIASINCLGSHAGVIGVRRKLDLWVTYLERYLIKIVRMDQTIWIFVKHVIRRINFNLNFTF